MDVSETASIWKTNHCWLCDSFAFYNVVDSCSALKACVGYFLAGLHLTAHP
jgi:hypothetical protein